ncbi:F-BOX PROTEIN SKIP14-LIKE [Salix purpurea]|uniref:F-BOX PROTEIN SKIP14-LIKE n=1 Tax=Salix purpurea TaxID=77065 RepID=A0A9Q0VSZ4_SALPP|nr:F-BOX PROTEIN SKIP14-LIKE [Salix purpurea]
MDIKFSRLTALFQDFDGGFGPSFAKLGVNGEEKTMVDDGSFVGVDLFFNGAWRLHSQEGNLSISDEVSTPDHSFSRYGADCGVSAGGFSSETNVHNWADCEKGRELGGEPHDALFFALGYLGVKDLLVAERLCRSLRDAVRGDPMLWRRIHIDQPLSVKITDEALVKLTSRAQGAGKQPKVDKGQYHCVILFLDQYISINPSALKGLRASLTSDDSRLHKEQIRGGGVLGTLEFEGCVGLTIDGILCNLRILKSAGTLRIKHIRIGGLFGVTENRFEEFKSLLGMDHMHPRAKTPQFHRVGQLYPSCDDDRAIDIEMCPKCKATETSL